MIDESKILEKMLIVIDELSCEPEVTGATAKLISNMFEKNTNPSIELILTTLLTAAYIIEETMSLTYEMGSERRILAKLALASNKAYKASREIKDND